MAPPFKCSLDGENGCKMQCSISIVAGEIRVDSKKKKKKKKGGRVSVEEPVVIIKAKIVRVQIRASR